MPHVVWAEESKTGLGFEIRSSYDDAPTTSQCITDGQSSCIHKAKSLATLVCLIELSIIPSPVTLNEVSHTSFGNVVVPGMPKSSFLRMMPSSSMSESEVHILNKLGGLGQHASDTSVPLAQHQSLLGLAPCSNPSRGK